MRALDVNRMIDKISGVMVRQVGSHRRYRASASGVVAYTTVPQHRGDIPTGTLVAIQRDMAPVFGEGWLTK